MKIPISGQISKSTMLLVDRTQDVPAGHGGQLRVLRQAVQAEPQWGPASEAEAEHR